MSIAERATASVEMTNTCTELALAGIRLHHGELDDDSIRWHLAARRYGAALANQVYGSRDQG